MVVGYHECRARVGSSQLAVDVLSGITVEYLANVGRTFRFYLDKYSNTMTSEVRHIVWVIGARA